MLILEAQSIININLLLPKVPGNKRQSPCNGEMDMFKGTGKEENLKGKLLIISVPFLALSTTNFT